MMGLLAYAEGFKCSIGLKTCMFLTVAMWNVTEEETNTLGIKHLKEYKAFQLHPQ